VIKIANTWLFIVSSLASLLLVVMLHYQYPRVYSRIYKYRHTLVSYIAHRLQRRRENRRALSLLLKILIATLISLAIAQPYVVVEREVYIGSKELAEVTMNIHPPLVIILDTSGSMGEGKNGVSKLDVAKSTLVQLVNTLSPTIDVGFIDFADRVKRTVGPTSNRVEAVEAIKAASAGGGTMYQYPLNTALNWLKPYRELNVTASVVFVSDGLPADLDEYRRKLAEFKEAGIPIYTVFIGLENEGIEEMEYIAKETGGEAYVATTIDELASVLNKAVSRASEVIQRVEVKVQAKKTIEENIPISNIVLGLTVILYLAYRFTVYGSTGVSF